MTDELKAKAEEISSSDTMDATIAIPQPIPEPIEDYDYPDYDDDEDDDYVSTPEGKAQVERFIKAYENGETIFFTDEEHTLFYKECFILTKEERQAIFERFLAKQK